MTIRNVRLTEAQITALLDAARFQQEEFDNQRGSLLDTGVANKSAVLSRAQDALYASLPKRRHTA